MLSKRLFGVSKHHLRNPIMKQVEIRGEINEIKRFTFLSSFVFLSGSTKIKHALDPV